MEDNLYPNINDLLEIYDNFEDLWKFYIPVQEMIYLSMMTS